MKRLLGNILKIGIPLAFGIYVIWVQYNMLTPAELEEIKESFRNANYFWVILALVFGTLSHVSRAYRWRFTMEPLGMKAGFINSFLAVMIGYVANIAFPRLGEVARCAAIARYEKQPFEKLFGTVVAERVADMLILLLIIAMIIMLQMDVLGEYLTESIEASGDKTGTLIKLAVAGTLLFGLGVFAFFMFRSSKHAMAVKIRGLVAGFWDGILSIMRMKKKWAFILHTLFIWLMYLVMFYMPFWALPETTDVQLAGVLAAFAVGGLSIVAVQGGIGVYPLVVSQALMLYGLDEVSGVTLGWLIWTSQTLMIISLGVGSVVAMPLYNKDVSLE